MSGWVLSVTAVICLTVLLDIIMPDGQMKKYVKGIVSIIVIFVIITPLASIAVGEFDLTKGNITIDSDMLDNLESTSDRYRETQLETMLSDDDITADVKIENDNGKKKVEVIIQNQVLSENEMNILKQKVKDTVTDFLGIDSGSVSVEVSDGS
ncbi:stage III sporulation protein AF [Acidaminococcus sp. CAG:917]|nr:stage III sporulation protein AF [Acidaminococcus sp. CAG:917]